ncbi:MAG TPA: Rap1a/Tai family immunity protein [Acidobacteriaceae bacterium]|nr:Rap1a/Tai family immunity protein [Acidobacteriaceae bacterium]
MKTIVLASFLVLTVPLFAQQRKDLYYGPTGEKLVSECRNITVLEPGRKGNATELTRCLDYITGVVDGAMLATDKNPSEFPACIPAQATVGDFAHTVMKYSDQHPEYKKKLANTLVLAALENAYSCGAPGSSK